MQTSFFKGALAGGIGAALVLMTSTALAGHAGSALDVFHLGVTNGSNQPTVLTGTHDGRQLQLTNNGSAATSQGLGVSSKSASAATLFAQNTGGAPAASLFANAGVAPFKVNSAAKVANLNADSLDGMDSGSFVQGWAGRAMYARKTVVEPGNGTATVTLLTIPGFVELTGTCGERDAAEQDIVVFGVRNLDTSRSIEVVSDETFLQTTTTDTRVSVSSGEYLTVQVGQAYRLLESGPVRTRMVTFFLSSGKVSGSCLFQAQALAQGY